MRYYFIPIGMVITQKSDNNKPCENVETLELANIISGNVKWGHRFGKQFGSSSKH